MWPRDLCAPSGTRAIAASKAMALIWPTTQYGIVGPMKLLDCTLCIQYIVIKSKDDHIWHVFLKYFT